MRGVGGAFFGHPGVWGWGGYVATKPKVMGGFGLGNLEHIAPHQKKMFLGVRGGWVVHFGALFCTLLAPFFKSSSDKKVCKTKKMRNHYKCTTKKIFGAQKL